MPNVKRISVRTIAIAVTIAGLAACTKAPPPPAPPPPPPPPQAEAVPYRPIPPSGAAYTMTVPALGTDGLRRTVNYGLSADEATWHFRSGWNVAALNCQEPKHQSIVDAYGAFLKKHSRDLAKANAAVERVYRQQTGSNRAALLAREEHMTQVYNYFALPPARARFCNAAMAMANEALATPPTDAYSFAARHLPMLESAFEDFYREYEQYQRDSYAWDVKYGSQYGASQPGYVAVYGTGGMQQPSSLMAAGDSGPSFSVSDPATGAQIPVTTTPEDEFSTPVVQPVPGGG